MSKKMTVLPSGAGPAVERPGLAEVSDRLGALPERLTVEAEVVVGVGEVRVAVDRLAIGLDRLIGAPEFVAEHGEIEVGDRIGGRVLDGSPVVRLSLNGLLRLLVEAAEIHMGIEQGRVQFQALWGEPLALS